MNIAAVAYNKLRVQVFTYIEALSSGWSSIKKASRFVHFQVATYNWQPAATCWQNSKCCFRQVTAITFHSLQARNYILNCSYSEAIETGIS